MSAVVAAEDPLGAHPSTFHIDELEKWSDTQTPHYDVKDSKPISIKYQPEINQKLALWSGDITLLIAEAIVNSTNESMSDKSPLSETVFQKAGPNLKVEIRRDIKTCKTGETRLTKAYQLPSRYIIHTVGPRYNAKYQTAAENALYNCYRNTLQTARENKIRTVGICCIHSLRRHYPVDEGAHIALRTVRRFIEHFGEDFDTVAFVVNDAENGVYSRLMPYYFPRSEEEAEYASRQLPPDLGNEFGEPVIPERQIRIGNYPAMKEDLENGHDDDDISLNEQLELSIAIGQHDFAKMETDLDSNRKMKIRGRTNIEADRIFNLRRYNALLKRARSDDLTEIASLRCLYQSGFDKMGRPVVVFVARHFVFDNIDLDKAVLYLVHVMDALVAHKFSVIWVHTETSKENQPSSAYLKEIYRVLDERYRDNLHALYMLHPTVWTRMTTWWFTTFTAYNIKTKVKVIRGVEYLYGMVNPDQLDFPPFVLDYDLKVNGTRYYVPPESTEGGL